MLKKIPLDILQNIFLYLQSCSHVHQITFLLDCNHAKVMLAIKPNEKLKLEGGGGRG
jgi:hypothetical protein